MTMENSRAQKDLERAGVRRVNCSYHIQHYCQSGGYSYVWEFPSYIDHLIVILTIIMKHSLVKLAHTLLLI